MLSPPDPSWIHLALTVLPAGLLGWALRGAQPSRPGRADGLGPPGRPKGPPCDNDAALERTREDVAAFKLEVARTYVPLSLIRDVDNRLTQHLLRIENKLDEATRAATMAAVRVAALEDDRP
ncbi:hypothetical protein [Roseomonas sp. BN140053]|uniref:hypothetical protein n=1 Tax=Roseomonas sp. BN140053 TaxID=3391898 RepID=UPI0039E81D32